MAALQYFHGGDQIRDTVVGIAASMAYNAPGVSKELPILAFANADDGIKVSARGTKDLVARGLDLSTIMREAAKSVGGEGGGHQVAAGATIPPGKEQEFLSMVDRMVTQQLGLGFR